MHPAPQPCRSSTSPARPTRAWKVPVVPTPCLERGAQCLSPSCSCSQEHGHSCSRRAILRLHASRPFSSASHSASLDWTPHRTWPDNDNLADELRWEKFRSEERFRSHIDALMDSRRVTLHLRWGGLSCHSGGKSRPRDERTLDPCQLWKKAGRTSQHRHR